MRYAIEDWRRSGVEDETKSVSREHVYALITQHVKLHNQLRRIIITMQRTNSVKRRAVSLQHLPIKSEVRFLRHLYVREVEYDSV